MNKYHYVEKVDFDGETMILSVNAKTYHFPLSAVSPRLAKASDWERKIYQISPSGYGIHWPIINEDLSINGLLKLAQKLADYEAS